MDISKLEPIVGQYIKNYKQLCSVLDIKETGGESKKAQLKELEKYCKYEREGHKFKIIEIYNEALPIKDGRRIGNNSKYVKSIELILLNYLFKQKNKSNSLTSGKWMRVLGMTNIQYGDKEYKYHLLKNQTNLYNYNNFMARSNNILKRILFDSLKNMQRRNLIELSEQVVIVPSFGDEFIARKYEIDLIKAVEEEVKHEMGYDNIGVIVLKGLIDEYYGKINSIILDKYKWYLYFNQYEITLIHTTTYCCVDEEILSARLELNNKIIDAINADAKKQFNKHAIWEEMYRGEYRWIYVLEYEEKTGEVGMPITKEPFKYNDNYIDMQEELSDKLIKIKMTV